MENRSQGEIRHILMPWEKSPIGLGLPWLWDSSQQHPELSVTAACWASCDSPMPWLC